MKRLKFIAFIAALFVCGTASAQFTNSGNNNRGKSSSNNISTDIRFRGEFNVGLTFGKIKILDEKSPNTGYAPYGSFMAGAKIGDYFSIGAGAGFKYITYSDSGGSISASLIPIFADIKVYYPATDAISPFLLFDIGYGIAVSSKFYGMDFDSYFKGGLAMKFGAGIQISSFMLSLGYDSQKAKYEDYGSSVEISHGGLFVSIGVVLGD